MPKSRKSSENQVSKSIQNFWQKNSQQLLAVVGSFLLVGLVLNVSTWDFQANVLLSKKSAPFDGTVTPVKKVPSWVDLNTTQWKLEYNLIPADKLIDLPEYIPSQLSIPASSIDYKKDVDRKIRNAQVTYSVPYMGNYKLEGMENTGSHLAVDMKMPLGTPVFAIANGVVIKASNQPGGFGQHIVLKHDDVPSINDSNLRTTYFSGYAHLSSISVSEGDLVSKGQQIGLSGQSGTATTPHLHFQIDNDKAPWHLYWPFTSKEASDAGLSFFEAINSGLGQAKALETTINPMVYVQKYKNYGSDSVANTSVNNNSTTTSVTSISSTSSTTTSNTSTVSTNSTSTAPAFGGNTDQLPPAISTNPTVIAPVIENTTIVSQPEAEYSSLQLKYDKGFVINSEKVIKVIALDKSGQVMTGFKPEQEINIAILSGSTILSKSYLNMYDFTNGVADFRFTPKAGFGIKLSFNYQGQVYETEVMQESGFTDLNESSSDFVAVNFLKNNNVVKGYSDGSFKPDTKVSRVEALKFIYEGLKKDTVPRAILEFKDTDSSAWYAKYVATAQNQGVVKGYMGNVFKPANSVTKAEFVKMLITAGGFNASNYVSSNRFTFDDVTADAWYANYVNLAKDKGLLDTTSKNFFPNQAMSRAEVAQVLYKYVVMTINGQSKYESTLVVNDDLAKSFYKI